MPSKKSTDFWAHARSFAGRNGPGGMVGSTAPTTPITLPERPEGKGRASKPSKAAMPNKHIKYGKQKG